MVNSPWNPGKRRLARGLHPGAGDSVVGPLIPSVVENFSEDRLSVWRVGLAALAVRFAKCAAPFAAYHIEADPERISDLYSVLLWLLL
jgi:hypothetical protein